MAVNNAADLENVFESLRAGLDGDDDPTTAGTAASGSSSSSSSSDGEDLDDLELLLREAQKATSGDGLRSSSPFDMDELVKEALATDNSNNVENSFASASLSEQHDDAAADGHIDDTLLDEMLRESGTTSTLALPVYTTVEDTARPPTPPSESSASSLKREMPLTCPSGPVMVLRQLDRMSNELRTKALQRNSGTPTCLAVHIVALLSMLFSYSSIDWNGSASSWHHAWTCSRIQRQTTARICARYQ